MSKYFYNGIELPELPEWDKEAYPYAIIAQGLALDWGKYYLYCSKNPIIEILNGYGDATGYVKIVGDYIRTGATAKGADSWGEFTEYTSTEKSLTNTPPLWTNTDILLEDGTLYLAASYPIDPETGEEIGKPEAPVLSWNGKDAYCVINGAWVKCDALRSTDGKWVKQDGYKN